MKKSAFIFLVSFIPKLVQCQQIEYGNNPDAGKYVNVGDAKIYYEVYGDGNTLILLHGGLYGYIDEYSEYIPELSKHFKVIAVAARGHGKSEIGTEKYSEKLFAMDVNSVLKAESIDSASVLGFSAGAATAYNLAALYPDKINKVVALGDVINHKFFKPNAMEEIRKYSWDSIFKKYPEFMTSRKKLMAEPGRASEWVEKLKLMWLEETVLDYEKAKSIKCKVLIVGGDKDEYSPVEAFVDTFNAIPSSQLAIIPNTGHIGLIFNPKTINTVVMPFLLEE